MWIVRLALRRPYTVAVMCVLILVMGVLSLTRMVVDIFPAIDIPVVAVVWNYPGLSARGHGAARGAHQRARLLDDGQRHRAHRVAVDPRHRPAQDLLPAGRRHRRRHRADLVGVERRSCASRRRACSRRTSSSSTPRTCRWRSSRRRSETLPEEQIFDYGLNFIRVRLFTIPGPVDAGAVRRQAAPDQRRHRSARARRQGAVAARRRQRAAGVERHPARRHRAHRRPRVQRAAQRRARPASSEFARIPVKVVDGAPVLLGDVAHVADAFADQTNIVRVNGRRATYLAILKHADASTLAVVDAARDALPADQGGGARRARAQDRLRSVAVRARRHQRASCARRSSRRCSCRS